MMVPGIIIIIMIIMIIIMIIKMAGVVLIVKAYLTIVNCLMISVLSFGFLF